MPLLGDYSQTQSGGLLSQALNAAREPIRGFMNSLNPPPDPLAPQPGPEPPSKYADLASSPFGNYNPLESNMFAQSLWGGGGSDVFGSLLRGSPVMPAVIAQARGMAPPTAPAAPGGFAAPTGPIARAMQARSNPTQNGGLRYAADAKLFEQIGAEEGVPADYLAAIAETENSADTSISPSGARGRMQVVPGQGFDKPGENPADPATSIRQGARALKAKYAATGSWDGAVAAYFGYGRDAGGQTTQGYTNAFQANLAKVRGQAAAPPASSTTSPTLPTPPAGVKPLKGITALQYGAEGLATGAVDYICGPVAAQAFVRMQGRNPTLQEALDLARGQGLIDPTNGMHGIDSTIELIRKLGGVATKGAADAARIAQEVQAGRPVILNTALHYFVAEDYDPATGRFDFGNSAKTLTSSGGRTWYTLGELAQLTVGKQAVGAPRGAIYAQ